MKLGITFLVNSVIFLLIFIYVFYSETGEGIHLKTHYIQLIIVIVMGNVIGFAIKYLNSWINKQAVWKNKYGLKFTISLAVSYVVFVVLFFFLAQLYTIIFQLDIGIAELRETYNDSFIKILILSFYILLIYLIVDFLIYSYNQYTQGQIESIVNIREQLRLQFEALKTQLSPHYLFNSLNTISSLVYKDPKDTELFIRNLSKTYKYILESNKRNLVSLQEEIGFVEDYTYLLKVRFGSSIDIIFELPDSISDFLLPPMSIQMLVENAAKHNVFSDDERLEVEIAINRTGYVIVRNNILKKPSVVSSFKIGLSNIKDQYKFFTDMPVKVKKDRYFTVELPLIKKIVL